jgi:hypothetical protein
LWREYGSNRLFFHSTAVTSRKEAEDFLKELEDNL